MKELDRCNFHVANMPLRISFKRGIKQSQQAARYFRGIVGGIVDEMLVGKTMHDHFIPALKGPSLHLRIWSVEALREPELHDLLDLLMILRTEINELHEDHTDRDRVAQLAMDCLRERLGGADLYVEVAVQHPDTRIEDPPELTLAIVHGRCAMISTDGCLFSWLQDDVFGLTLAGHGSYLLEVVPGESRQLRRAS